MIKTLMKQRNSDKKVIDSGVKVKKIETLRE